MPLNAPWQQTMGVGALPECTSVREFPKLDFAGDDNLTLTKRLFDIYEMACLLFLRQVSSICKFVNISQCHEQKRTGFEVANQSENFILL